MKGNKVYRHKDNPEEKRFHDEAVNMGNADLSAMVFEPKDGGLAPSEYLSEREEKIVVSAIQWLGSPVGQNFLRDMGYEKQPEIVKKEMTDKERRYVAKRCRANSGWSYASEITQDKHIHTECIRLGFTKMDFFAADGKFLTKILKR